MRLDADCIRDVLLCIEENTGLRQICFFVDSGLNKAAEWTGTVADVPVYQKPLLEKYGNDKLIYHVRYCLDAKLAVETSNQNRYKILVADLSPAGHELLAKIRDPERWPTLKKGLSAVKDYSLSAINAVAEGVTSAGISALFSGQM